jgi:predicted component of type VI protein secretion system
LALGSASGAVGYTLAYDPAEPDQPFVVLHEGRHARLLRLQLQVTGGAIVGRYVWKLRSDACRATPAGPGRLLSNAEVDALWAREMAAAATVGTNGLLASLPVPSGLQRGRPIVHCRRRDLYFQPVGRSGGWLTVCRDEARLAAAGLPPYGASTWRYLAEAGVEAEAAVFYRVPGPAPEQPRPGVEVVQGNAMFADWAAMVAAGEAAPAAARERLPCLGCPHRSDCYAASGADRQAASLPAATWLRFVSFYDFDAMVLPECEWDYDQLCAVLGGGPLPATHAGMAPENGAPWAVVGGPQRWPLEALLRKLAAFQQLCRGLRDFQRSQQRPHLGVAPRNVLANPGPGAGTGLWREACQVWLTDFGSAVAEVPGGLANAGDQAAATLWWPGPEMYEELRMRPYLAPSLVPARSHVLVTNLRFAAAEPRGERLVLVADAEGVANSERFQVGDLVSITPTLPAVAGAAVVQARIEAVRGRQLRLVAEVSTQHAAAQWAGREISASCTFYRRLSPAADLHGLGMLLFRTLLANDEQGIEDLAEEVLRLQRRLQDEVAAGEMVVAAAAARLRQYLASKDQRQRFAPFQVLELAADRAASRAAAGGGSAVLPPGCWEALLDLGFRLTSTLPGHGLGADHGAAPGDLVERALAEVELVRRQLLVAALAPQQRDAAIAAVVAPMVAELQRQLLHGSRAGLRGPGFRLEVTKDGETAVQVHEFVAGQPVTIGRRESGNLLRLVDPMVSSMHAVIERQGDGYVILDRNSRNGTEVDGIRLPGEVEMPLEDGAVVRIRPFRLLFRTVSAPGDSTLVLPPAQPVPLRERLDAVFAAELDAPRERQLAALQQVLAQAAAASHPGELLRELQALGNAAGGAPPTAAAGIDLFPAAHRALGRLGDALVGAGGFQTAAEVDRFADQLLAYVQATAQTLAGLHQQQHRVGQLLGFSLAEVALGTAEEIQARFLAWDGSREQTLDPKTTLRDCQVVLNTVLESLLPGADAAFTSVASRLAPDKLLEQAGRSLGNLAAAKASLWRHFVDVYQGCLSGGMFAGELRRNLQQALAERRGRSALSD